MIWLVIYCKVSERRSEEDPALNEVVNPVVPDMGELETLVPIMEDRETKEKKENIDKILSVMKEIRYKTTVHLHIALRILNISWSDM